LHGLNFKFRVNLDYSRFIQWVVFIGKNIRGFLQHFLQTSSNKKLKQPWFRSLSDSMSYYRCLLTSQHVLWEPIFSPARNAPVLPVILTFLRWLKHCSLTFFLVLKSIYFLHIRVTTGPFSAGDPKSSHQALGSEPGNSSQLRRWHLIGWPAIWCQGRNCIFRYISI
jgi:hypothetical protein